MYALKEPAGETGKQALRERVQSTAATETSLWPWLKEEAGIVWWFGMLLPMLFLLGVIGAAVGWW